MSRQTTFPDATYDSDADAAYVWLRDAPWSHMEIVDDYRNIDYAIDGAPVGVEFLYVSKGVNLAGLPEQPLLCAQLTPFNLTVVVREQTKGAAEWVAWYSPVRRVRDE